VLILVSLMILSALYVSAAKKGKQAGIVNSIEGKAVVFHIEDNKARTIAVGNKIYVNDRIVTEKNSKVQIILRNDCVFTVAEKSELVITKDMFSKLTGKRETVISLLKGKLRSVVGKSYSSAGSKYEVHTRTAIAGVRGTQNLVETSDNPPSTNVYGIENTTNVKNSDKKIKGGLNVGPGKGAKVPLNGPPEPFDFDFDDPSVRALLGGTTIGGGSGDAEDDVNMGSFQGGPDAVGSSEHRDIEPFDIEQHDRDETPPFDQTPEQNRDDSSPEQTHEDTACNE
ncbi:FecR domain-containing protein, partial [bacterium]|nr:FecR domain-containing protein [bacterium]